MKPRAQHTKPVDPSNWGCGAQAETAGFKPSGRSLPEQNFEMSRQGGALCFLVVVVVLLFSLKKEKQTSCRRER